MQKGAAGSMKRILFSSYSLEEWGDDDKAASPWNIEPFVEMKTIWHPSSC
jgi:hypothetical protein